MPIPSMMAAVIRETGPLAASNAVGLSTSNDYTDVGKQKVCLSALHQRTVTLQISAGGRERLLVGRGVYEQDSELGSVLRIACPPDAGCEFLICETIWNGEIQTGEAQGCDFLIRLSKRDMMLGANKNP